MTTRRLGLAELVSGQAVPEDLVNENMAWLDAASLGGFVFIDRDLAAPPGSPQQEDCYLVAASATGAWAGEDGNIALYINTAWEFREPQEGFEAWVADEDVKIAYSGAAWGIIGTFDGADYVPTSYLDTDDTLAANSDVKVPTQQAVKAYVDNAVAGVGGGGGGTFHVANYGALGDGVYLADGATTNADATFTSATAAFDAGDIGKVIEITSGANVFKSTIASVNSATSIELTAPPSFTATGCDVYYGTDDTDAIQDTFDAAEAALGGIVEADAAIYIIDGPLQDTSRSNAQILFARRHVLNAEQISVALHGAVAPPTAFSVIGSAPVHAHHTIFKSTLNSGSGTLPSVFGAWGPSGSSDDFTHLHFEGRNFAVRCPSNPVLSGMNLKKVASVDLDHTVADVGYSAVADLTEPTTSTSIGIALPDINNGACVRLGTVNVIGFYNGYSHSEHAIFENVNAWGCRHGVKPAAANYPSRYIHFGTYHCQKPIVPTGAHILAKGSKVSIEHAASGTWAPVYDLDDTNAYLTGDLEWHSVLAGTGPHDVFTFNGGSASLRVRQAGRPDGRVVTLTGTAHTASLAENHAFVRFTNGSAVTYTLPQDSAVNFPVGSVIEVSQAGAGALSFAAGTGATVSSRSSDLTLAGQYAVAFAKKVASNTWQVDGDL